MPGAQPSWEDQSREEREFFDSLSIAELHGLIQSRQFGKTDAIWYSLLARSTLRVSAWPLLEVLERRSIHQQFRHHAATVLLRLMDSHDWSADSLADAADPLFESRLREFRLAVMAQLRTESA
jgi:uncharacterized protein YgfB (UPF0149 family)